MGGFREFLFDAGVFLNISEDHISPVEHKDFQDYFHSKLLLFRQVKTACVNLDSPFSRTILRHAAAAERIVTFGTAPGADICGYDLKTDQGKVEFRVKLPGLRRGVFSGHAWNLQRRKRSGGHCGCLFLRNSRGGHAGRTFPGHRQRAGWKNSRAGDGKIRAIVDFAHNGLSFEKIFETVKLEYPDFQVTAVFGCPGGKALNRRKDLGLVAGKYCSHVYLSTDDPGRNECRISAGKSADI